MTELGGNSNESRHQQEAGVRMYDHPQQGQTPASQGSFWTSRAFLACAILLAIAGVLLWTEHLAHALGLLPFLLILACPLLHIFMHGGHGGHGGRKHQQTIDERAPSKGDLS
jgi:fatty acid desaturase